MAQPRFSLFKRLGTHVNRSKWIKGRNGFAVCQRNGNPITPPNLGRRTIRRRRPRPEDRPGYWTGPSAEEALQKIYGSPLPDESPPATGGAIASGAATVPASRSSITANSQSSAAPPPSESPAASTAPDPPMPPRRDAWSRWARQRRRRDG